MFLLLDIINLPSKIGFIALILVSITYFLMLCQYRTVLQEVNRLLTGLNCGKVLETITLPESATSLSVKHGFDAQV